MEETKVWKEFHKDLERFVRSKIKDEELCKDFMQEIYIRMHDNIGTVRDGKKMKSWLFSVAGNMITDHFRKQKQQFSLKPAAAPDNKTDNNLQFEKCLVPHINKLPQKYKEAFVRVELGNTSQVKLAEELKISYSGLKSRVQRARQLLKGYFKNCCNISTDKYGNIISYSGKHACKTC